MYPGSISTRPGQPAGAATKTAFALFSTVLIGTGTVYGLSRADSWRHHVQPRVPFVLDTVGAAADNADRPDVRTAAEHIENIRNVLNPPVADLAAVFEVSRQAVYKWLSGGSTPEDDKLGRIRELSRVADEFQAAGISRAGTLLKMKAFAGRSLMDLIKSGESRNEHVRDLVAEARAMEDSYRGSGLATSKSRPTSDWQASVSIPGGSEQG